MEYPKALICAIRSNTVDCVVYELSDNEQANQLFDNIKDREDFYESDTEFMVLYKAVKSKQIVVTEAVVEEKNVK